MAEGKKSIIVYADWLTTFESLEEDEAGRLIVHFLRYVNDKNPEPPDRLTQLLFEPIKSQLKRDLVKWDATIKQRSEAGKASAASRERNRTEVNEPQRNPTLVETVERASTNPTVTVNVNDNDINTHIRERGKKFTPPTLEEVKMEFENKTDAEMFFYHFEANGWATKSGKMKSWIAAANGWKLRSEQFNQQKNGNTTTKTSINRTGHGTAKPAGKVDTGAYFPGKYDNTHWDM